VGLRHGLNVSGYFLAVLHTNHPNGFHDGAARSSQIGQLTHVLPAPCVTHNIEQWQGVQARTIRFLFPNARHQSLISSGSPHRSRKAALNGNTFQPVNNLRELQLESCLPSVCGWRDDTHIGQLMWLLPTRSTTALQNPQNLYCIFNGIIAYFVHETAALRPTQTTHTSGIAGARRRPPAAPPQT